ncbi:MAG: glycosyltransferase family A protein [Gallionellaceae bacterium]|jgi:glycosyltransferase involved in cell wall biosynthesis
MLDITVGILSYNRGAYLREAVLSVLAQTKQAQRIVIYDNGSDANVFEAVQDLLGEGVQWAGAEFNQPFIWNFTRAMRDGESRYVMMLHDDDRLRPDFLETQIALLDSDPSLIAVSSNGYYIDHQGRKNGETLASTASMVAVEFYTCSGQVAMKYAKNSCIPLSPAIYRRAMVAQIPFREEFGKVLDAVYFCDLADQGAVAYQTMPLYECRRHDGQDSNYFPYDLMNQLEVFYASRKCANEQELARLNGLLLKQHAARNLKQIVQAAQQRNWSRALNLFQDEKFRLLDAVNVLVAWGSKSIFRKLK